MDTVINGHSNTTTTWADLKEFADFNKDFLTWSRAALKVGQNAGSRGCRVEVPETYQGDSSQVSNLFGGVAGRLQRCRRR